MSRFSTLFRRIIIIGSAIVLIAIAAIAVTVVSIDPNKLKTGINKLLAQSSQLSIAIDGDLSWQLFPSLAVNVGNSKLYLDNQTQAFAQVEQFAIGIDLTALWQGQWIIETLNVDGLTLNLRTDQQGQNNWQHIASHQDDAPSAKQPSTTTAAHLTRIQLNKLSINQLQIHYQNMQAQTSQHLLLNHLSASAINTAGQPFSLSAQAVVNKQLAHSATIELETLATLSRNIDADLGAIQQASFNDLEATITLSHSDQTHGKTTTLPIALTGKLNFAAQPASANDGHIQFNSNLSVNDLSSINIDGAVHLDQNTTHFSGSTFAELSDIQALLMHFNHTIDTSIDYLGPGKANLSGQYTGEISNTKLMVSMNSINAKVDESAIRGEISLYHTKKQTPHVKTQLHIDSINLNRYLSSTQQTTSSTPINNSRTPAANNAPLPFELLDHADIEADISIDHTLYKQLTLTQLQSNATIKGGDLAIPKLQAKFYGGDIFIRGNLTRSTRPHLSISQDVSDVNVEALLKAMAIQQSLSGTIKSHSTLGMTGNTIDAWLQSLNGRSTFTLDDGYYNDDNIEQRICQAIAKIRNTTLTRTWPSNTAFKQLNGQIDWKNGIGKITDIEGGLSNLTINGQGNVDLPKARYDAHLDITVTGESIDDDPSTPDIVETDTACRINDKYRHIKWPLHCYNTASDARCQIDQRRLEKVLAELAKEEARSAIQEKFEEKLGEKLEGPLNDLLKGGLKDLFK